MGFLSEPFLDQLSFSEGGEYLSDKGSSLRDRPLIIVLGLIALGSIYLILSRNGTDTDSKNEEDNDKKESRDQEIEQSIGITKPENTEERIYTFVNSRSVNNSKVKINYAEYMLFKVLIENYQDSIANRRNIEETNSIPINFYFEWDRSRRIPLIKYSDDEKMIFKFKTEITSYCRKIRKHTQKSLQRNMIRNIESKLFTLDPGKDNRITLRYHASNKMDTDTITEHWDLIKTRFRRMIEISYPGFDRTIKENIKTYLERYDDFFASVDDILRAPIQSNKNIDLNRDDIEDTENTSKRSKSLLHLSDDEDDTNIDKSTSSNITKGLDTRVEDTEDQQFSGYDPRTWNLNPLNGYDNDKDTLFTDYDKDGLKAFQNIDSTQKMNDNDIDDM